MAYRRIDRLPDDSEEARMWLFGVARRVLANHRRGAVRRATIRLSYVDEPDKYSEVREAIEALPANQRELVQLVHWDGFSLREAAGIAGVSESTARGRYERARKRLHDSLRPAADAPVARLVPSGDAMAQPE
ncbi:RNA polymerase sigma factor [Mycetocola zhadangensis]|uniref:RNA polymerase sigma factor n=1 Tax=Mycetocola zhadangensis TaxID=1164595 RepID=UPI001E416961|nr:RNA polymerase sigma factor [Mycetocola zhadangensis]